MEKQSHNKVILIIAAIIAVAAILCVAFILDVTKSATEFPEDEYSYSDYNGEQIFYEGQWYIPRKHVESILIFGVDTEIAEDGTNDNSQQADFFALLVLDKNAETYKIIYINRDTITDVPQVDAYGQVYGTTKAQLCIAHVYGKEEKVRCRNTINAVENLLYDVDIDHYISLTMEAVPILNDSVGGVTLELMDDFTYINESYVKGATVTLTGREALSYVQARGELEISTNVHRMERQEQYIRALIAKISGYDVDDMSDTLMEVSEYITSDCTVNQLSALIERIQYYTEADSTALKGESVKGVEYMEFYVDEEALKALIVDTFYELRD